VTWFEDAYGWVLDRLGFLADPFDAVVGAFTTVVSSAETVVVVPVAFLAVAAVVLGRRLADEQEETDEHAPGGLLRSLARDVKQRFAPLVDGIRLLASAGFLPMLVVCLALVVVGRGQVLAMTLARQLWGPVETSFAIAVAPIESAAGLALAFALTAPLLATAVDWLLRRQGDQVTEPPAPRSPAAATRSARA
jgi:hypothetical protein